MKVWMHSSAVSLNKTIISDILIFVINMIINATFCWFVNSGAASLSSDSQ